MIAMMMQAAPAVAPAADEAQQLALTIADATFSPEQTERDGLTAFDHNFDASSSRAIAGRPLTAAQRAQLARQKAAGHAELQRLMHEEGLPHIRAMVASAYRSRFTTSELQEIAAFWTSPAGRALTAQIMHAMTQGQAVGPVPGHQEAVARYTASAVGQKEIAGMAAGRTQVTDYLQDFLRRALPKMEARMAAARRGS